MVEVQAEAAAAAAAEAAATTAVYGCNATPMPTPMLTLIPADTGVC